MAPRHRMIGRLLAAAVLLAVRHARSPPPSTRRSRQSLPRLLPKKEAPKKDEAGINAPHAILIDAENGGVLFERDPDKLIFPASLAKLMTAEYVFHELKEGRIKLTDEYPGQRERLAQGRRALARLDDVRRAPQQDPGRRPAARHDHPVGQRRLHRAGRGACRHRRRVRRQADPARARIGLAKSVFTNSNGLPDPERAGHHARTGACWRATSSSTIPNSIRSSASPNSPGTRSASRTAIRCSAWSTGADGLKTGFTKEAGYGLVGSAVQNGLRLIVVVNGEKSAKERADEAKKLLEWGFRNFRAAQSVRRRPDHRLRQGLWRRQRLCAAARRRAWCKIMVPKSGGEKLIARIVYHGPVPAPVTQGQPIGELKVWRDDNLVLRDAAQGRGERRQAAICRDAPSMP